MASGGETKKKSMKRTALIELPVGGDVDGESDGKMMEKREKEGEWTRAWTTDGRLRWRRI